MRLPLQRRRRHHFPVEPLEHRTLLALIPAGVEFQVNTNPTGDQFAPVVARADNGNFVVAWVSDGQDGDQGGIYAQRYSSSGSPEGSEFRVNTITSGPQNQPAVAMDAVGDFVVTWTSASVPGASGLDIVVRRYNASGVALDASEFLVNTYTTSTQESPAVVMDATGNFAVVWDSNGEDGSDYGVYGRRYNASGAPVTGEIQIAQTTQDLQADPSVAMDAVGDWVVAWNSGSLTAPTQYDIYARRFNFAGVAQGNEFRVNNLITADFQTFPTVAMDKDGDFVVTFDSFSTGSDYDVYAKRYTSSGTALGNEFLVNTTTAGAQSESSVDIDARGDFTVVWSSADDQDGSGRGVYMQSYNFNGVVVGGETRVNTDTINNQDRPAVALNANGDAIVVWQDGSDTPNVEGEDGSGYGIFGQRYNAPDQLAPTVTSATFNCLTSESVTIVFSESVTGFTTANVTVQDLTHSITFTPSQLSLSYAGGTNPATISFTGFPATLLTNANYRVTLSAAGISDSAGNALDGDNNGSPGGNFTFDFFVLNGDANHDRKVDAADLGLLSLNWNQSPRNYAQGDFNYDGVVNVNDLNILAQNWQQTLAVPVSSETPDPIVKTPVQRAPVRAAALVLD